MILLNSTRSLLGVIATQREDSCDRFPEFKGEKSVRVAPALDEMQGERRVLELDHRLSQAFVQTHNRIIEHRNDLDRICEQSLRIDEQLAVNQDVSSVPIRSGHLLRLGHTIQVVAALSEQIRSLSGKTPSAPFHESVAGMGTSLARELPPLLAEKALAVCAGLAQKHREIQAYQEDPSSLLLVLQENGIELGDILGIRFSPFSASVFVTRNKLRSGFGAHLVGTAVNLVTFGEDASATVYHENVHTILDSAGIPCLRTDIALACVLAHLPPGPHPTSRQQIEEGVLAFNREHAQDGPALCLHSRKLIDAIHEEFVAQALCAGFQQARYWEGKDRLLSAIGMGQERTKHLATAGNCLSRTLSALEKLRIRLQHTVDEPWAIELHRQYQKDSARVLQCYQRAAFIAPYFGKVAVQELQAATLLLRPTQYGLLDAYFSARFGHTHYQPLAELYTLLRATVVDAKWISRMHRVKEQLPVEFHQRARMDIRDFYEHTGKNALWRFIDETQNQNDAGHRRELLLELTRSYNLRDPVSLNE